MNNNQSATASHRTRNILLGSAAGLTIAAIIVIFVLPAETGIDPTGFGEASGLTEIANPQAGEYLERGKKRTGVLMPSQTPLPAQPGERSLDLYAAPIRGNRAQIRAGQGRADYIRVSADGPLSYDMHAHPFDGGEDLTESYAIAKANQQSGRYVAAFSGIHGWHWQNRSMSTVTLTLDTSGKINGSKLLDGRTEQDRPLTPKAP